MSNDPEIWVLFIVDVLMLKDIVGLLPKLRFSHDDFSTRMCKLLTNKSFYPLTF